jgi:hypothetical protein
MPAHHKLEQFLDEYLDASGIRNGGKAPLFRSAWGRPVMLTDRPMHRIDAYQLVRRRTAEVGLNGKLDRYHHCVPLGRRHTRECQPMAAHESPRTTKLYDRTKERLTQDEVERIRL